MPEKINIHEGHRKRLKERFLLEGLDNFNEINTLELLLFYCVQRKDTNPLAHRLLTQFGGLAGVMSADAADLMKVEGVTEHIATYLTLMSQFSRYNAVREAAKRTVLETTMDCGHYMVPYFRGRTREAVAVACLDSGSRVICCKILGEGSINSASVSTRTIAEYALSSKASSIVLAHNHPSGVAIPSAEDIRTTELLARSLGGLDIILADHIVVCGDDFVSLMDSSYLHPTAYVRR